MNEEINNDSKDKLEKLRLSLVAFRQNEKNNILVEDLVDVHYGGSTSNLKNPIEDFERIENGEEPVNGLTMKDYTTAIMMANRVKNGPVMLPIDVTRNIANSRVLSA